ncbi:Mov34/MPN/PAD-1 family protein [Paenibacillus protaetiae]|uniref:MPN domain-containing protein n=1 Tax=Paenibacillus protaetiae TaxID=2509456 RepID=A0A4P6F082_9BACL|nr:Mov34/MPN/PAD-1 family protein [Paenibacillus protaetiae]QAY66397.1 hypothetical protein ET464_08220 [Paenibacillus protaetiae]
MDNMTDIRITQDSLHTLTALCLSALPHECCGLLTAPVSSNGQEAAITITGVVPVANIHPQPETGFAFDPAEWVEAYFRITKNRQHIAGMYHSHPSSPPVPSVRDLEGLPQEEASTHWIVSLSNPQRPAVKPYRRNGNQLTAIPLVIA